MKKWILIGIVILLIIISIRTSVKRSTVPPMEKVNLAANQTPTLQLTTPPTSQLSYKILNKNSNKVVENISALIDKGSDNGEKVAADIKKTCQKKCNIDVYDDQKAFGLQKEYDDMMGDLSTKPTELTNWKKKNYVYIADHLVGSIDFETERYSAYPLKDWYYKELTGQK